MELPELVEFDYSVRANLANSSVCGDVRPSVVLKLQLKEADGSERQVCHFMLSFVSRLLSQPRGSFDCRWCWSSTRRNCPACFAPSLAPARYRPIRRWKTYSGKRHLTVLSSYTRRSRLSTSRRRLNQAPTCILLHSRLRYRPPAVSAVAAMMSLSAGRSTWPERLSHRQHWVLGSGCAIDEGRT